MRDHSHAEERTREDPTTLAVPSGYHGSAAVPSGYHASGSAGHSCGSPETLYAWGPEQSRIAGAGWGPGPHLKPGPIGDRPAEPLKVVHVGPCLMRGGAEQWLVELTRFLDPSRVRVLRTIATQPGAIDPTFAAGLSIPIENGGPDDVTRAVEEADVLLCWGVPLDDVLNGHKPGLCVFVAHGDGPYTQELVRHSGGRADHYVAVSHRVRDTTLFGLPSTVIYNGVDSARLARTRPREEVRAGFGFGPEDFVVGYLGRFSAEKRVPLLIEAASGLPPEVKVLLVGWGAQLPELMAMANRRMPGRFAVVTAGGYLGDYYSAMDAFCLLGTEEGFSLAMLEAMMCGIPLIATPVGAVPELIVDRINGQIVSPKADAVKEAIDRLRKYPRWAAGLAAEARTLADRQGHAVRMARDYEDLLERLWMEKNGARTLQGGSRPGSAQRIL